ncbi:MAG TPA: glycosyltransferase family 2 protein, partial [Acidimicrobiales bacterium]|nr:glycosyltransferase family 2 protein [Acidimicrobiales bacterium]
TDAPASICRASQRGDARVRYFRQPTNIGIAPNHNFVIDVARGELFKSASHDDLYARDLLERCVEALDAHPEAVLAHSWSALIDDTGAVIHLVDYPVATSSPRAPDRFRSMLFDGWGDDEGGVVRLAVLRRTALHGSYHFADRTFTAELGLHGPFHIIPERLYFRRHHQGQAGKRHDVRERCALLDPVRGNRLRHPALRLYGEYPWSLARAVASAPLTPAERRECYAVLARWTATRALPVAVRVLARRGLTSGPETMQGSPALSLEGVVAGRKG